MMPSLQKRSPLSKAGIGARLTLLVSDKMNYIVAYSSELHNRVVHPQREGPP